MPSDERGRCRTRNFRGGPAFRRGFPEPGEVYGGRSNRASTQARRRQLANGDRLVLRSAGVRSLFADLAWVRERRSRRLAAGSGAGFLSALRKPEHERRHAAGSVGAESPLRAVRGAFSGGSAEVSMRKPVRLAVRLANRHVRRITRPVFLCRGIWCRPAGAARARPTSETGCRVRESC